MKLVLDTCVLFPTVMREVLYAVAEEGVFAPLFSEMIFEEWAETSRRKGEDYQKEAEFAIFDTRLRFPRSCKKIRQGDQQRLYLPDTNDIHIFALAVSAGADGIVTANAKDFPRHLLAEEGISRLDPDAYLQSAYLASPTQVGAAVRSVHKVGQEMKGEEIPLRQFLKRARMPRLAKAMA